MDRNSTQHAQSNRDDDLNAEVLIGRIVDGEASPHDTEQFEKLAAIDHSLWRRLALRQQDMAALVVGVEHSTEFAERHDLAIVAPHNPSILNRSIRPSWLLAFTGWAALLAVGVVWAAQAVNDARSKARLANTLPVLGQPCDMTPDDHLREYLNAPFVQGEMPTTLLSVEVLPDGRKALHVLRRIEEIVYIKGNEPLPVDPGNDKKINKPLTELRGPPVRPTMPN
jgi:hypothetical protein